MNVAFKPDELPLPMEDVLASGWAALARFGIGPAGTGDASDFFGAAGRAEILLCDSGLLEVGAAIAAHTSYLADKRQLADAALLGSVEQAADLLTHDAICNIAAVLNQTPDWRPAAVPDPAEQEAQAAGVPAGVLAVIKAAEQELQGWCSREKAVAMARLVLQEKPNVCVEIGIFGGRSLVPCAAALQANGAGRIYGVECWNGSEAVRNATNEPNDAWWLSIDFAAIKENFLRFVVDRRLTREVCIIEASSRHAAAMFESIDFLHIDGSHAVIGAAEDVLLYATKVRPGGIIVFDDTQWPTTLPAQHMLAALGQPLMTPDEVRDANYATFRRT